MALIRYATFCVILKVDQKILLNVNIFPNFQILTPLDLIRALGTENKYKLKKIELLL